MSNDLLGITSTLKTQAGSVKYASLAKLADKAGLTPYFDKLGFNLVGYSCTTCIGNS
ncbi:MAG: aconitase family protein [Pseudomonas sp.]|nr:aconitase family protein [Pseudomonas sp.]